MDEKLKKAAGELSEKTGKAALLAKEKLSEQLDNEQMKKAARAVADKSKEALEKAKNLNAEDIKNVKEIGSKAKQELEKCSKKKNPAWIVVVLGILCVVGIFSRIGGSSGSGYEKILGMNKSAVEKKYGAPVAEDYYQNGLEIAATYSEGLDVSYVNMSEKNRKAYSVTIAETFGSSGQIMGLKIGDSMDAVEKTLKKHKFKSAGVIAEVAGTNVYTYENSKYVMDIGYDQNQKINGITICEAGE